MLKKVISKQTAKEIQRYETIAEPDEEEPAPEQPLADANVSAFYWWNKDNKREVLRRPSRRLSLFLAGFALVNEFHSLTLA